MASKDRPEPPKRDKMEPRYHVYMRLPFNRGDFVDPPPVNWDESKSDALWAIISGVSQTEINWSDLAANFDVSVEFLLQMVSYLTERHTSSLKAQMRKVAAIKGGSSAPSPIPGAEHASGYPTAEVMRRTGSGGGRAPSSLSIRKDSPLPRNETAIASGVMAAGNKTTLPLRPQVSRNSSANTTVPTQKQLASKPTARLSDPQRRRLPSLTTPPTSTAAAPAQDPDILSPGPADSTSSASSSSSGSPVQSRIIRRPPRFQPPDGARSLAEDDDEAEPAFLPYKTTPHSASGSTGTDMGATLRGDARDFARRLPKNQHKDLIHQSQTSDDSSTGSAAMVPRRSTSDRKPAGPLSPRRTAELAGRSPGGKGKGVSREGSDGTPSMGSSFSDLDDASVTQSALEEALASRMQDGTIGSRMTTIGQAFRSRYLPKSNQP
ncbi:hypothetical protein B0T22DRAFT_438486 [Podospora appendiculata]|uniref:Autophagy-related protein 29 n=1 Tax=Podospora appendiculata TaxID=314037 RepID=A0AAE1CIE9_9PEZI|nr:hypothetical protein B0T22DRAFT_438486 [Podospora appendiculata]